ncbi:MAG: hypothetical protein HW405_596 [Candidatus Berkelbacteria bacterium]|nr:hypothetical protein [Candidatus Berkelbacteria bacterium]
MKKIFKIILGVLRGFFVNHFWKSIVVLITLGLSLALNGILWYIYVSKIKHEPTPFVFASALIVLNFSLGNFLWNREKLTSYFLIYTCLFIQILMLLLVRYLFLVF